MTQQPNVWRSAVGDGSTALTEQSAAPARSVLGGACLAGQLQGMIRKDMTLDQVKSHAPEAAPEGRSE